MKKILPKGMEERKKGLRENTLLVPGHKIGRIRNQQVFVKEKKDIKP